MTDDTKPNKSLLLIHGRDFKPAAETYLELSVAALRTGLVRDYPDCIGCFDELPVDLAWYGDLNAEILLAKGESYDEELDVGDRRNALQALSEITPRKKFGIRLYDQLPGKSALPEFFMDVGAPLMRAVGFRTPVLARLAKDVAAYYDKDSDYAEAVRQRLRD